MSWSTFIRDDLRAKISGADALPAELTLHGLSQHYGVSTTPVRIAVGELIAEDYLLRKDHGRLRVNPRKLGATPPNEPPTPPRDQHQEIARDLIAKSLEGEAVFVREREAAEKHGISTAAVREVFHRLAGSGVLRHLPRRGWQLRPFRLKDLENYLKVREVLELTALDEAWSHLVDEELEAICDGNQLPGSDEEWPAIDDSLHDYLIKKADNRYILDFFERHGHYYKALFEWDAGDRNSAIETVLQHREIIEAMLCRDRRTARKTLGHHIRTNYALLKQQGGLKRPEEAADGV
jgi:DNA-binding GntR family transcriptional regulator